MEWITHKQGATPIDDISGLKLKLRTQQALNAAEAENIARVALKYLAKRPSRRSAPFTYDWLLKLHREMFARVWEWAGEPRTKAIANIGFVAPYQIQEELKKLVDDLSYWQTTRMDSVEQSVRLHHRAVWIHPFTNGNGRWSRMLADILLRQNGASIPIWPAEIGQEESPARKAYIAAIRAADKGNFEPLIALQKRYTPPTTP